MTISMTGFASLKGEGLGHGWTWDLRSVNGKGLDLRLRVPDWIDGLESALRAEVSRCLSRGNVSLSLKLAREGGDAAAFGFRINPEALKAALEALGEIERTAMDCGVSLRSATTAEVLGLRGLTEPTDAGTTDSKPLRDLLMAGFSRLIESFQANRASEGAALALVIATQTDRIAALVDEAAHEAQARRAVQAAVLHDQVSRLLANTEGLGETRLMQEVALLAVKTDVTEELDRLLAHIDAARRLLSEPGAVGRKFDFLMQEFMREANTLCSKAQSKELTRIGLDLKTVIDQMREQVQNVE